jgi:hypothetical protein
MTKKIFLRSLALALIAICASVAGAVAAVPPVRGGTYRGLSSHHHKIVITVNRDGRHGKLTYCRYSVGIIIARDHFGVNKTTAGGAVHLFRIHGAWVSKKVVKGYIDLDFTACDGLPGPFKATLG